MQGQQNRLIAVIESINDGVYMTDANGTCILCNQAFERITGLKSKVVVNKHVTYLLENNLIYEAVTLETLSKKQRVSKMIKYPSGCEALVTGNPVFGEKGELVAVICTIRDLTELNALKEELHLSKQLTRRYRETLNELKAKVVAYNGGIVARDPKMQRVVNLIERVANSEATVLISGESGVGKTMIAELIHKNSPRAEKGNFVKIDCGSIPETLLESELFGYESGAFTGARRDGKAGLIELANHGTLFLDEIGELPLNLQVKLLSVLQDRRILRVGGVKPVDVDLRIVAATNKNLEEMLAKGTFRKDLFYRLNVVPILVPPLRERKEDILTLVVVFLKAFNKKYHRSSNISPEVLDCFLQYPWPGNVRELENTIERLVVLDLDETIDLGDLPETIKMHTEISPFVSKFKQNLMPLREAIAHTEKELIKQALAMYPTLAKAAAALEIDISTLIRKRQKFGIKL